MATRQPFLREGADPRTVVIRPRAWDYHVEPFVVTLHPSRHSDSDWEVYADNGDLTSRWVGTVGRYTGSLDRKIAGTRLRSPGKQRVLWSSRGTQDDDRTDHQHVSRADAIRALVTS